MTLTRKVALPLKENIARRLIRNYLTWELVVNVGPIILHATEIGDNYRLSFWDSLIVAAAYSKNASIILTEDLNDGQHIEGDNDSKSFIGTLIAGSLAKPILKSPIRHGFDRWAERRGRLLLSRRTSRI